MYAIDKNVDINIIHLCQTRATNNVSLPLAATHLVRDSCLCLHVHRAARALARRFDDVLGRSVLPTVNFRC